MEAERVVVRLAVATFDGLRACDLYAEGRQKHVTCAYVCDEENTRVPAAKSEEKRAKV